MFAPHYAEATPRTALALTPLRSGLGADAPVISELLAGDCFDLLELSADVAWGRSLTDGLVGYVAAARLGEAVAATHRVVARAATLHEAPDPDSAILTALPMGSRVAALGDRGPYLLTSQGYIAADALAEIDARGSDAAAAALRLIGAPMRPGGRSGEGVDAAGLVFLAHDAAGIAAPRLPDLIADAIGPAAAAPTAGEVVVFERHLAIMADAVSAVHVEGRVVRERLAALAERHGPIVARGRIE